MHENVPKSTVFESNFPKLSKPAQRALIRSGYHSLEQLTLTRKEDLAKLHGIGPKAVESIEMAMKEKGLSFSQ